MQHNRMVGLWEERSDGREAVAASGFVMLPVAWAGGGWQQELYRRAYEQALAVVRPSRLERLQAVALN
jgi:hypothetical protein